MGETKWTPVTYEDVVEQIKDESSLLNEWLHNQIVVKLGMKIIKKVQIKKEVSVLGCEISTFRTWGYLLARKGKCTLIMTIGEHCRMWVKVGDKLDEDFLEAIHRLMSKSRGLKKKLIGQVLSNEPPEDSIVFWLQLGISQSPAKRLEQEFFTAVKARFGVEVLTYEETYYFHIYGGSLHINIPNADAWFYSKSGEKYPLYVHHGYFQNSVMLIDALLKALREEVVEVIKYEAKLEVGKVVEIDNETLVVAHIDNEKKVVQCVDVSTGQLVDIPIRKFDNRGA